MPKNEEFSIIIPVFNRATIVTRTLESVKAQTYRPIHLIIVDNSSTDHSFATVTRWSEANAGDSFRISIFKETVPGASAARNRGLQAATSDKVVFFDSDDTMRPSLVEEVMKTFALNPDADMVTWKCLAHPFIGAPHILHHLPGDLWQLHMYHAVLRTQGYAVKKKLISRVGKWSHTLKVWNDWELGVRLILSSPRIVSINKVLVDIYHQEKSITGTGFVDKAGEWEKALQRADEIIEIAESQIPKEENFPAQRLHSMVDYRRVILAAHYWREGRSDLAATLLDGTLYDDDKPISFLTRMVLRICYIYTRMGGRGASKFAHRFF